MDIVSDSDRCTSGPCGNLGDGNDDSEYHHTVKAIQYKEHKGENAAAQVVSSSESFLPPGDC